MAKRKAASARGRKGASRKAAARKSRPAARKSTARKAARKGAATRGRATARKAAPKKKKAAARKATARKATARKATARKAAPRRAAGAKKAPKTLVTRKAPASAKATAAKVPALNRARRTVEDEDLVQGPPSSLDLDRTASAARTGRRKLSENFREHTETSPAMTGGDVDADWESAYSVGDEAPGGDNPTPDQDIVDEIGRAVGIEYEDNEELKGEKKVSDRDKHRWELDPASAEDYPDHEED